MNVLVINSGSSSVKYQLIDTEASRALVMGKIERLSGAKTLLPCPRGCRKSCPWPRATRFLEERLALRVNVAKSAADRPWRRILPDLKKH
jgi:hypothetical protein